MTVGSRSTNTALGTCFPAPVSLKKVLKESSPPPMVLSLGIWPSGWIPCSRQYNSQQALPIWTPAWPTWTEIHSRCGWKNNFVKITEPKSDLSDSNNNRSVSGQLSAHTQKETRLLFVSLCIKSHDQPFKGSMAPIMISALLQPSLEENVHWNYSFCNL